MKLRYLPPRIRALAKLRQQQDNPTSGVTYTNTIFDWERSPEGHEFWSRIDRGLYVAFYEKYGKNSNATEEVDPTLYSDNYLDISDLPLRIAALASLRKLQKDNKASSTMVGAAYRK